MALPVVKSIEACADFFTTVLPYVGQLYDFPQQLIQSYNNPTELYNIYMATNPLISAFAFSIFLAPIFLVVSEINKNYSQVDRCWSLLPTIYIAHFTGYAHLSGLETQRLDNILTISFAWSLRLTYNYWRKGGYSIGSEDYRWIIVKEWCDKQATGLFFVFNVLFISLAQSVLLFLIATPAYIMVLAARAGGGTMNGTDILIARGMMFLIIIETFADQQQWNYQKAKKSYLATAKVPHSFDQIDLDRGFVVNGLWSWSRHPNFAAEQAIWVALYQWSVNSTHGMYNWTGVGALGYLILFQASTWFTELITSKKYPEYKEYQNRVGKFLPYLASELPGDFSDQKTKPKEDEEGEKKKAIKK